jgi:hypothetical protein
MPLISSDVDLYYSLKTGAAGNSAASTAAESLGKYISTTPIVTATLYNLFPTLTGDQNAASASDYKCFFVRNKHATLTALSTVLWLSGLTANSVVYSIGVDTNAASAIGASAAQAAQIATTANAPAGVTFTAPTTKLTGIVIGDILAGQCRAVWVRRTAANTPALNNDSITLNLDCDTRA